MQATATWKRLWKQWESMEWAAIRQNIREYREVRAALLVKISVKRYGDTVSLVSSVDYLWKVDPIGDLFSVQNNKHLLIISNHTILVYHNCGDFSSTFLWKLSETIAWKLSGQKKWPLRVGADNCGSQIIIMCRTKERRQLNKTNERRFNELWPFICLYYTVIYRICQ